MLGGFRVFSAGHKLPRKGFLLPGFSGHNFLACKLAFSAFLKNKDYSIFFSHLMGKALRFATPPCSKLPQI